MMKKTIYVQGMHCHACEKIVQQECKELGCVVHTISHKTGEITIDVANESVFKKLLAAVKKNGYTIPTANSPKNTSDTNWTLILTVLISVGILVYLLSLVDLTRLTPSVTGSAGRAVALLLGIVASLSTCLAMTGSLVVGFAQYMDDSATSWEHAKTQIMFHAGRWGSFFVLGGVLGLLGQSIQFSLTMTAVLTIVVSAVLIYMGLYMLDIVPSISKFGFHLPAILTTNLHTHNNPALAPVVGALTFLLPCGFTQSMQLVAMNSASFMSGGITMLLFAIGTTPVLFAVGMGGSYIKDHRFKPFIYIIGALIIYASLFSLNNAFGLLGTDVSQTEQTQTIDYSTIEREELTLGHDGLQLIPFTTQLEAGKSYKITITPSSNGIGCMSTMTVPKLDRSVHPIIQHTPITYEFPLIKAGTYPVVCGSMGMAQGQLVVK